MKRSYVLIVIALFSFSTPLYAMQKKKFLKVLESALIIKFYQLQAQKLLQDIGYQKEHDSWILKSYLKHIQPLIQQGITDAQKKPTQDWKTTQSLNIVKQLFSNDYIHTMWNHWKHLTDNQNIVCDNRILKADYIYCLFPLCVRKASKLLLDKDCCNEPYLLGLEALVMITELNKHV